MPRKRKREDVSGRHEPRGAADRLQKSAEPPLEFTELVLVVHAGNIAEGELFKTELEAHGIPAILEGEGASVAGIPDVGAGIPVLVPEEFADRAEELIAELKAAKPEGNALEENENLFEAAEQNNEDLEKPDDLDEEEDADDEDWEDDDEEDWEDEEYEDDEEWDEDEEEEDGGDDDV